MYVLYMYILATTYKVYVRLSLQYYRFYFEFYFPLYNALIEALFFFS